VPCDRVEAGDDGLELGPQRYALAPGGEADDAGALGDWQAVLAAAEAQLNPGAASCIC
jgi:hypothetical protein